ncbi:YtxH domain-containing protein [Paenibacillus albicereus]|uniref:YtxH domain-containing protein n=1 Tax=Paenibacillus albicereus TaxID=2726185 RepID=A0A6H2GWK9_9BACL|nr:YtxH domain-containing protein [Paenibacillus albicereus]QJC51556.1 YtxH domain-containing protein [Paenibacillus albicereus]
MVKWQTKKRGGGFLLGALAGGIIGSVTALLFAPKSGSELRSDIGDRATRAADKAGEIGSRIGSSAAEAARHTADSAAVLKEKAIHTADQLASGIKFWERKTEEPIVSIASVNSTSVIEAADTIGERSVSLQPEDILDEEEASAFLTDEDNKA